MNKILIIDDEVQIRSLLARMLELEGYEVCQAGDCKTAIKQLEIQSPDVALCDVFLPDGNGVDLVLNIKKIAPNVEVILLTAHGNIPDGVQAIKNGAFDYITKGDDNNKIIPLISRAVEKAKMNVRLEKLEKKVGQMYSFDSILGESKVLKESVSLAQKVSVTDVPVLLTGETGTGKEVFAQAIHYNSKRSKQNFVAVNCSSFSKELLESEMFGHKAGSFTGALKDKKGLFEEANNGTIFLDEIGEMAFELQAKLLRILETGEYIKIGDTKPTRVNVRIIAATNRNLQEESSLAEVASKLNLEVKEAANIDFNSFYIESVGVEPKLIGAVTGAKENTLSKPVAGQKGVFLFDVTSRAKVDNVTPESEKVRLEASAQAYIMERVNQALTEQSKITDNRVKFF